MDIVGPVGWSDFDTAPKVLGHSVLLGCWGESSVDFMKVHGGYGWGYIVMGIWAGTNEGWCVLDLKTGKPTKFAPKFAPTHWKPMDTPDGSDYMGNYAKSPT